jgi:hypothetical protein
MHSRNLAALNIIRATKTLVPGGGEKKEASQNHCTSSRIVNWISSTSAQALDHTQLSATIHTKLETLVAQDRVAHADLVYNLSCTQTLAPTHPQDDVMT